MIWRLKSICVSLELSAFFACCDSRFLNVNLIFSQSYKTWQPTCRFSQLKGRSTADPHNQSLVPNKSHKTLLLTET